MTKSIAVRDLIIGGGNKIVIQSMTNTKTYDIDATIKQINELTDAGCELVRCSIPDSKSAKAISEIKKGITVPLVADIHFDYKLAVESVENGVDKVRINPGNIGSFDKVKYLAEFLNERKIPIRIGVNSGSIEKDIFEKYGSTAEALVESALRHVALLEQCSFYNTIISVKASSVIKTIDAYRLLSKKCDYPLHLGVTEAGIFAKGLVKSAIGIGTLLMEGIGDTIRVSLTGDPVKEVIAARDILSSVNMLKDYVEIVACPTCARTNIPVEKIAEEITAKTMKIKKPLKVAIMGCVVNGIGEGKDADIGVAGGVLQSVLFNKGEIIKTVKNEDIIPELLKLIDEYKS